MTREEAIKELEWALKNNTIYDENEAFEYILAVKKGIEALEQEPCEDYISRAEALKNLALTNGKDDVYRMINSLPSIQPKPKTGYWIEEPNCWTRCSWCGEHYPQTSIYGFIGSNYCPNCGAKMESEVKE